MSPERGGLPSIPGPSGAVLKSALRTATPSGSKSLTVNVLLLTIGGALLYAGIHNVNLIDAALGRSSNRPSNTVAGGGESSPATVGGRAIPGLGTLDGKPVSRWIIVILLWARSRGWKGRVESGYRTKDQQLAAARSYGLEHYGSSGPLGSNHVGINYPRGAVDVTYPEQLAIILKNYPGIPKLVWGGPVMGDDVHFSATGH